MDENLVSRTGSLERAARARRRAAARRRGARRARAAVPASPAHLHPPQDQGLRGARRGRPVAHRERTPTRCWKRSASSSATTPEALALWKEAGADVKGDARAFPARACRARCSRPRRRSSPSMRAIRSARCRSAATPRSSRRSTARPSCATSTAAAATRTIEDFRNFVKLAYMAPAIHHSGGTVCEPVDVPVNKRHLDMVYSHIRYSDKPFMGSVTRAGARRGHGRHGQDGVRRGLRREQHAC